MLFSGGSWHSLWQIGQGDSQHRPSAAADPHLVFNSGSSEGILNWFEHSLLYYSSHKVRIASALLTSWSYRDITSSKLRLSAASSSSSVFIIYHAGDGVHLKYALQLKFLLEKNTEATYTLKAAAMTWPPSRTPQPCAGLFHLYLQSLHELRWAGKSCRFKQLDFFLAAPKELVLSF